MTPLSISNLVLAAAAGPEAGAVEAGKGSPLEALVVQTLAPIGVAVLLLASALCVYRIVRGPHLADRVLASDTFAVLVVGIVVLLAIILENDLFFDAALVVGILGFVSTLAFSQYIGDRRRAAEAARAHAGGVGLSPGEAAP
ncbi:MAG: monovalent cation/H+ antiporter complex subunit F [Planctomycetota bacterium]